YTDAGLEQAQLALDAQYRARGYNRVRIDTQAQAPRDSESREVAVLLRVDEGPQQRLREIVTEGVSRTRPSPVSRPLRVRGGGRGWTSPPGPPRAAASTRPAPSRASTFSVRCWTTRRPRLTRSRCAPPSPCRSGRRCACATASKCATS